MKLTQKQIHKFSLRLTNDGWPVRFLHNGCALNIITGDLCISGSNIFYHPVYWRFDKDTAREIADFLGVKAVFEKGK